MSGPVDPATGQVLPADAIQRVLFICHPVHVYAIPPLTSMKGYRAADWTGPPPEVGTEGDKNAGKEIFIARLRVMETAVPVPAAQTRPPPPRRPVGRGAIPTPPRPSPPPQEDADEESEKVKTDILLEDQSTGQLFAAAPYTSANVVEQTVDSSRFFALRVEGEGGRKAMLGIGFEDRAEAFDFGVTLQDARKVLGFDNKPAAGATPAAQRPGQPRPGMVGRAGSGASARGAPLATSKLAPGRTNTGLASPLESPSSSAPKDYSLKPGQKISISMGGRPGQRAPTATSPSSINSAASPNPTPEQEQQALFSLAPPPPPAGATPVPAPDATVPFLPPPPPPAGSSDRRRRVPPPADAGNGSSEVEFPPPPPSAPAVTDNRNPFDDDDFGEFQ